jgi:hypothetical protein
VEDGNVYKTPHEDRNYPNENCCACGKPNDVAPWLSKVTPKSEVFAAMYSDCQSVELLEELADQKLILRCCGSLIYNPEECKPVCKQQTDWTFFPPAPAPPPSPSPPAPVCGTACEVIAVAGGKWFGEGCEPGMTVPSGSACFLEALPNYLCSGTGLHFCQEGVLGNGASFVCQGPFNVGGQTCKQMPQQQWGLINEAAPASFLRSAGHEHCADGTKMEMAHCRGKYSQLWTFLNGILKSNGKCMQPVNYTQELEAVDCDGSSKQNSWVYEDGAGPQRFKFTASWAKTMIKAPSTPTTNPKALCDSVGCECQSGFTTISTNTLCCCNPSGRVVEGERVNGIGSANVDCKYACAAFKDEYTAYSKTLCVGGTFEPTLIGEWGKIPDQTSTMLTAVKSPSCRALALSTSEATAACKEKCTSMPGCDGFALYPSNALGVMTGGNNSSDPKSFCCFKGDTRQRIDSGDVETTCYAAVDLSGEYRVKSNGGGGYLATEASMGMVITTPTSNEQSRFVLERQHDGRYKIKVKPLDYHVSSEGAYLVFSNGDQSVIARENYNLTIVESDKFTFVKQEAGYYAIEVEVGTEVKKTWIVDQNQLQARTGGGVTPNNMFFHLEKMTSSKVDYEMCLDLTGEGDTKTELSLVKCGHTASQRWYLNRYENMRTQANTDVCMALRCQRVELTWGHVLRVDNGSGTRQGPRSGVRSMEHA